MISETDKLLVQQIKRGGSGVDKSWNDLVERYEGRLRAYVRSRLRDPATADDVVQDTFIGFLRSLTNYDEKRDLQTWLFTIAAHKVTDRLRKVGRQPFLTGNDSDEEQLGKASDDRQRGGSSIARSKERMELETEAIARGLRELVRGYIQKADYSRVQVLELLFVKGMPNKDVAVFLHVNEQQVANYRFAAVKKLTEQMKAAGLPMDVFPELNEGNSEANEIGA